MYVANKSVNLSFNILYINFNTLRYDTYRHVIKFTKNQYTMSRRHTNDRLLAQPTTLLPKFIMIYRQKN